MKYLFSALLALVIAATAFAFVDSDADLKKPIALVYLGPGSCAATTITTGCSQAARAVAEAAGFEVHYIGPDASDATNPLFSHAKVWIQPGGRARLQAETMAPELKAAVVDFVKAGGGYVGFCAGGFMATEKFGWDTEKDGPFEANGLGLLPGKSWYYNFWDEELSETLLAKIIPITWKGFASRDLYWEVGPYFVTETFAAPGVEVIAHYKKLGTLEDDPEKVLTLRGNFGKGRVYITAIHPEAPMDWRQYYKINDTDGVDFTLGIDMVHWSALVKDL